MRRTWLAVLTAATTLTLGTMIALETSGGFGVLNRFFPVSLYALCAVAAAAVAALRFGWLPVAVPWAPTLAAVGYLLATTVSALASGLVPATTAPVVMDTLKLVLYVAVIGVLAAGLRSWDRIAVAVVAPMAAICLLAAANQFLLGNSRSFLGFETVTDYHGLGVATAQHAGPLPDPNFWGRFLVVGLPFALALTQRAWTAGRRGWSLLGLLSGVLLLVGVYLTGSRGSYLATVVAVGGYLLCAGVRPGRLLLSAIPCAALLLVPGIGSRLSTLVVAADGGRASVVDPSLAERLATQQVAWAMVRDHPVTGVGPGGYFEAFGRYAARGGISIDRVIAPHDLYLGLWAEVGLVGLLAFGAILAVGLVLSARTVWATRGMTRGDVAAVRPYAAALLAGTAAWCVASTVLHLTYTRILLLLVVLAATLWQQARRLPQVRATAPSPVAVRRGALGLAGGVLAAAGALTAVSLVPHGVTVSRVAVVHAVPAPDALTRYLSSLKTRSSIVPGYAVLVDVSAPGSVDAYGDVESGTVTVSASGPNRATAEAEVAAAIRRGSAAVHRAGMDRIFTLDWRPAATTRVAPSGPPTATVTAAGLGGAAGGVGAGLLLAAAVERRSRRGAR